MVKLMHTKVAKLFLSFIKNNQITFSLANRDGNSTVPTYSATIVRGKTAGVATELEECSKIGLESNLKKIYFHKKYKTN
jgi:hypothetical protein